MGGPTRQRVRERHVRAVMRALVSLGVASRSALATHVGLDRSTMTHVTSALLEAGLIEPIAQAPSGRQGGRRAELLAVERSRFAVVGADVQPAGIRWVLCDLRGNVQRSGSLGPSMPSAAGTVRRAWIQGLLEDLKAEIRTATANRKVLGVGLALPGLFDQSERRLVESVELGLTNVDLAELWHSLWHSAWHTDTPSLRPDNDATCYAWREIATHRRALSAGDATSADGVYVYTKLHRDGRRFLPAGVRVGVTVVAAGRIVSGARGAAGRLRGYRWSREDGSQLGIDLERIRVERGEQEALTAAATELVRNLVVVASVLDPMRIVIAGDLAAFGRQIQEIVGKLVPRELAPVEIREPEPLAVAHGAAQMVLEGLFSNGAHRMPLAAVIETGANGSAATFDTGYTR